MKTDKCQEEGSQVGICGLSEKFGIEVCSLWSGLVPLGCVQGAVLQDDIYSMKTDKCQEEGSQIGICGLS